MITIFPVISGVHITSRGFRNEDTKTDDGTEKGLISPFKIKSTSSLDHTTIKTFHNQIDKLFIWQNKTKDNGLLN